MLTPTSSAPTLRVAIYRTSSIGDIVLATACIDLLSQLPIPTEITWIGRGTPLELIGSAWPEVKTFEVRRSDSMKELPRICESLSSVHLLIDLQCNLRSRWLAHTLHKLHGVLVFSADKAQLSRHRLLLESRLRGRRKPLPEKARVPARLQYEKMCDTLRQGLKHHLPVEMRYGMDELTPRPRLPIPESLERPWRKELRFGAWLAIAPGAAHATKAAPFETFRTILEMVKTKILALDASAPQAFGLVFVGDDADRQIARQLLDHLHWRDPVLNLAGRLSLFETAAALKEATCLLSNDSSLGHIAEAVDTPTAILFGPTVEGFGFPPRMRESRAFSSLLGCRPCSKHGKASCRYGDKLCFASIPLDDVASHLVGLLTTQGAKPLDRLSEPQDQTNKTEAASIPKQPRN